MAVAAVGAVGGTIVCLASPQGAMAARTHRALRLTQGTGYQWKCQWMSPSASIGYIERKNHVAQPSAMAALALTAEAKGELKMILKMVVRSREL